MDLGFVDRVRARLSATLEAGQQVGAPLRLASALWGMASARGIARPLAIPRGVLVVGVGSAVLGGAGKTPIAMAIARALRARGSRVAIVSHAYRAAPGRAREVLIEDLAACVGDDALASARGLAGTGVAVFVGPTRAAAVALAASRGAGVVVIDGLLQSTPVRVAASVLVLDGAAPWGGGACPPVGDLRAPKRALLAASDLVAVVRSEAERSAPIEPAAGAIVVPSQALAAVAADGSRVLLSSLAGMRVGLLTGVAHPERITAELSRRGVRIAQAITLADHARMGEAVLARARRAGPEIWLTTSRCATKLPPAIGGAAVWALEHEVDVGALVPRIEELLSRSGKTLC